MRIITDVRLPCSCGSALVPRQSLDEATGLDTIACMDCGASETLSGYEGCITAWNAANTTYTWQDIVANGGPIDAGPSSTTGAELLNKLGLWDPSNIGSISKVGDEVTQINDLSGNGMHLINSAGSSALKTGTQTLNGLNVLFNDSNDYVYQLVSLPLYDGSDLVLTCVIDQGAASAAKRVFRADRTPTISFMSDAIAGLPHTTTNAAGINADPQVLTYHLTPTSADMYINGVLVASEAAPFTDSPDTIFLLVYGGTANAVFGKQGEAALFRGFDQNAGYLLHLFEKWGITP